MQGVKKLKRTECDAATAAWIDQHPGVATTLGKCVYCGLYYKTSLGHKCKKGATDNNVGLKDRGGKPDGNLL